MPPILTSFWGTSILRNSLLVKQNSFGNNFFSHSSFQPYYEEHGTGSDEEDFGNGEDEDSNDENYYANDYPDEDPDGDCCGEEDDEDDFVAE